MSSNLSKSIEQEISDSLIKSQNSIDNKKKYFKRSKLSMDTLIKIIFHKFQIKYNRM